MQWSQEFNCSIVNGVLAPIPLNSVPFNEEANPRNRGRRTEGDEELFFELFKFPDVWEQYLLEIHEVGTGDIGQCHLIVYQNDSKWKVRIHDFNLRDHELSPMVEDPIPLVFHKKYELSLQQRLVGWTLEKRRRSNGKEDTFYYHQGRQFRSLIETATFILYSAKQNDLNLVIPPPQTPAS
ncbi:hypothetical protein C2S51_001647 [Perilla frutescens var. frutescens]|nr:hypothetical protein C2S51_001647 [Perilla frutescens var. frutescens]